MNLARCTDQPGTLEEFYTQASGSELGHTMLRLIERLRALPDSRVVWGLTSHYKLCLLAENRSDSHCHVSVIALDGANYFIEYRMPDAIAPWPQAYVRGEAHTEDEALHMITTGMANSGGWLPSIDD